MDAESEALVKRSVGSPAAERKGKGQRHRQLEQTSRMRDAGRHSEIEAELGCLCMSLLLPCCPSRHRRHYCLRVCLCCCLCLDMHFSPSSSLESILDATSGSVVAVSAHSPSGLNPSSIFNSDLTVSLNLSLPMYKLRSPLRIIYTVAKCAQVLLTSCRSFCINVADNPVSTAKKHMKKLVSKFCRTFCLWAAFSMTKTWPLPSEATRY